MLQCSLFPLLAVKKILVEMPESVEHSKKFDEDFSIMRKYCITHKKRFSELTVKDYEVMGIRPF